MRWVDQPCRDLRRDEHKALRCSAPNLLGKVLEGQEREVWQEMTWEGGRVHREPCA